VFDYPREQAANLNCPSMLTNRIRGCQPAAVAFSRKGASQLCLGMTKLSRCHFEQGARWDTRHDREETERIGVWQAGESIPVTQTGFALVSSWF
jgi:hypothetical protein